jgi:hypothetical protein
MFRQHTADPAEMYGLEHRFPIGWALAGLAMAGNVASAVLMLAGMA